MGTLPTRSVPGLWISLTLTCLACSGAEEERALPVGVPEELRRTFDANVEAEGDWVWFWDPGYDTSCMRVKAVDEETLEIWLGRFTCFGMFQLATRATRTAAGIRLDHKDPMFPEVLYPARFDGEERLVPDEAIGRHAWDRYGNAFRRDEGDVVEEALRWCQESDRLREGRR